MRRANGFLLATAALALTFAPAAGQVPGDACGRHGYSIDCALRAAGIAEFRDTPLRAGEREIRYWSTSGYLFPDQLLVLRQDREKTSGTLILMWVPEMLGDSFARKVCGTRWSNAGGAACVGKQSEQFDWKRVIRQLDDAGLAKVPDAPVESIKCDTTPIPPPPNEPDRLPIDRICGLVFDGFTETIEVRAADAYWRYEFRRIPDPASRGIKRDQALLAILRRASRKVGDGVPPGVGP